MRLAFRNARPGQTPVPLFPDSTVESFDQIGCAPARRTPARQEGYLDNGVMRWTPTRASYS
jgi:hypothetical protein